MKNRMDRNIIAMFVASVIIGSIPIAVTASSNLLYKSQGVIKAGNIVIDTSDFKEIDNTITQGKAQVTDALNERLAPSNVLQYTPGNPPTFGEMTNAISSLSDISEGNVAADEIVKGKIAYNSDGKVVGTMTDTGLEEYNRAHPNPFTIGASYGWVLLPLKENMVDLDEYIEMADSKMYEMKVQRDQYRRD